ncbi:putative nuclease HARBI1 [Xyrichtys novacula]|uniref:Nuclease HARBI1 n=1 Tax=Xyrichtys novacula TaxID=13765 RepID=A0AAV1FZT3_XYRNO|nr:putative nuclease HARBI1 [Xyrichtys novacula]
MACCLVTVDIPSNSGCTPLFSTHRGKLNRMRTTARRVEVKRAIGMLKGRWQCLDTTEGSLSHTPTKDCICVDTAAVGGHTWCCGVTGLTLSNHSCSTTNQAETPRD